MSALPPKDRGKSEKNWVDANRYNLRSSPSLQSDLNPESFPPLQPQTKKKHTTSVVSPMTAAVAADYEVGEHLADATNSVGGATEERFESTGGQTESPREQVPRTFASIFKDAENIRKKGTLRFIAPFVCENGKKRSMVPDELIVKQNDCWSNTLVGYFIGKRPAFPFVRFHANRLWRQFDLEDVILNDEGYFYFKFKNEQGLNHVFESGSWLFNDIPVLLKKWQPDVWLDKPIPTKVSIWVNIYDMPAPLWNYEILSHVVSAIGVPIAVDRYTAEMCEKQKGRASYARVLVEFSADEEIPRNTESKILGAVRKFRLEYNWTPSRCSHCKIFGHTFAECTARVRNDDESELRMAAAATANQIGPSGTKVQVEDPDQGFQQPKKRRRPTKAKVAKGTLSTTMPKDGHAPKKASDGKSKAVRLETQVIPVRVRVAPDSLSGTQAQSIEPGVTMKDPIDVLCELNMDKVSTHSAIPEMAPDPDPVDKPATPVGYILDDNQWG